LPEFAVKKIISNQIAITIYKLFYIATFKNPPLEFLYSLENKIKTDFPSLK
jgi:hypothetical protein